jgi:MFS family permease
MASEDPEKDSVRSPLSETTIQAHDNGILDEKPLHKTATNDALSRQISVPLASTLSLPREILFVAVICLAQFTTQVGFGQVLFILHDIGRHFNLSNPGELSWLVAGYSLTVGTFILFAGRLGDTYGYKRMLIIGYAWFAVWTLVSGVSSYSNHVLFVFARVLAGIGPAMTLPNGVALLGASYENGSNRKNMAFALFGACAPSRFHIFSRRRYC